MFQRSSLSALAALAVGGVLIAGCSSSSSSASAPAVNTSSAAAAISSAAASLASSAGAAGISAADCGVIAPISSGVITTLTPLQSESGAKQTAGLKAYIAKLQADQAKLTSPAGKAALGAFVSALNKSLTEPASQAQGDVTSAVEKLLTACVG